MRALEFTSKIKDNQILIPNEIHSEFSGKIDQSVRVIVLVDDFDSRDELVFGTSARNKFLEGYSDLDSVYDNY